MDGDLIIVIKS